MKRTLVIMLTLSLMLAFSSTVSADQTQKASVCELYSVDGFYEDDLGNQSTYSFHIPQINADTPDAEEINKEIAEEFGTLAEDQFENMKNGLSLIFGKVDWDAYWNGDQLFLLLTSDTPGEIINYAAYGYDFENGCRVTNEMILEQKGISEEEYIEELRAAQRTLDMVKEDLDCAIDKMQRRIETGYEHLEKESRLAALAGREYVKLADSKIYETATSKIEY